MGSSLAHTIVGDAFCSENQKTKHYQYLTYDAGTDLTGTKWRTSSGLIARAARSRAVAASHSALGALLPFARLARSFNPKSKLAFRVDEPSARRLAKKIIRNLDPQR
jgi:hypothetical protein